MTMIIDGTNGQTFPDGSVQDGATNSGVTTFNLSSGTPNGTLTSTSNQLVVISATAEGCSVTMPDMTTIKPLGNGYFTLYNTSSFGIAIKDSGGTTREYLGANTTYSLNLRDNSTATGIWGFYNIPVVSTVGTTIPMVYQSGTATSNSTIIPVTATQFVIVDNNQLVTYARLGTINTTTRAITYGSAITLYSNPTKTTSSLSGTSDRVSRGFIALGENDVNGTVTIRYVGFAIVSNTLYVSALTSGGTTGGAANSTIIPVQCDYLGANNSFFMGSYGYSTGTTTTNAMDLRQFTVNVTGTTVTVTAATGNTTLTGGSFVGTFGARIGRTGTTSYVVDTASAASTFSAGYYVSCNTATNTLTQGARTTQNTAMMVGVTSALIGNNGANTAQSLSSFVSNASGTRVFNTGIVSAVTNAGTATVTVAIATDITYKMFGSNSYNILATTDYPLYTEGSAVVSSGYSVSSSNFLVTINSKYYSFDPSASTFNINFASSTSNNYLLTATTILYVNAKNIPTEYNFIPVATPIKV